MSLSVAAPLGDRTAAVAENFDAERAVLGDDDLAQEGPVFDALGTGRAEVIKD